MLALKTRESMQNAQKYFSFHNYVLRKEMYSLHHKYLSLKVLLLHAQILLYT